MLRPGHVIALCVIALLTIGVVMVNSAGMGVKTVAQPGTPGAMGPLPVTAETIILSRSTVYMGLALIAMGVGAFMPVRRLSAALSNLGSSNAGPWANLVPFFVVAGGLVVCCAMVYMPVIGREVNGSHRWIGLGGGKGGEGLSMQPSEIAKWGLVLLIAWYGTVRARAIHEFWRGLVPALVAIGAVAGFIVLEDLGTGALIAAAACVVLLAAGARLWQFLMFVPLAALAFTAAIVSNPYRITRITAFMDPYADPEKSGYHMIQSLVAIANGQGFGRGLGHGLSKMGYLPEDRTDFIFAIICEELGIAGAGVVVGLFSLLLWAGYSVMKREDDRLLRLYTLGVLATVGLQALINLAVVTGLAPTKGIALPMLSSGGTGWILTAFSLGLIVAIDRGHRYREIELAPLEAPVEIKPLAPVSSAPRAPATA